MVGLSRRENFLGAFGVGVEVSFHEVPAECFLKDGEILE